MPIYLYWGEEEYNLENAVKDLKNKILDPDWAMLNYKFLDEPEIQELIETLQTLPMVFGNILIEIKAASLFLRGNRKISASDAQMSKLIDLLENVNQNVHVLFVCPIQRDSGKKIDSVLKLTKTIDKIGEIRAFDALKAYNEDKLVAWIIQRAKSLKITISNDAALLLLQNTGPELRKLDSELEKLKLSVYPNKSISIQAVMALSSSHENVFYLADLWLKGDNSKAIIELHKLFEKDHALKIIATLQTIVRRWLRIKLESRDKNSFEISKIINLHKFVVEKDLEKLRNIQVKQLVAFRDKLTQAEFKIKSGELDPEMSLEMAIIS